MGDGATQGSYRCGVKLPKEAGRGALTSPSSQTVRQKMLRLSDGLESDDGGQPVPPLRPEYAQRVPEHHLVKQRAHPSFFPRSPSLNSSIQCSTPLCTRCRYGAQRAPTARQRRGCGCAQRCRCPGQGARPIMGHRCGSRRHCSADSRLLVRVALPGPAGGGHGCFFAAWLRGCLGRSLCASVPRHCAHWLSRHMAGGTASLESRPRVHWWTCFLQ